MISGGVPSCVHRITSLSILLREHELLMELSQANRTHKKSSVEKFIPSCVRYLDSAPLHRGRGPGPYGAFFFADTTREVVQRTAASWSTTSMYRSRIAVSAKIIYIHGSAPRRAAEVLKLAGQLTMVAPHGTVAPISRYI